ncbi:2-amino-4-ketopentanoate thiolase [Candidatus Bipolaricaulota bacterium]|nr:2-amino-4-ketopentanoate thiolase [Candidatus Bipolaricaulota bacterium]
MEPRASIGDWVQIERIILRVGERAPQVPEDTQATPLISRVKGFALQEGAIGEEMVVETVIGRRASGRLVAIEPSYSHDFGGMIPELLPVGGEALQVLRDRGTAAGDKEVSQ